jgi:hypothetical protein
MWMMLKRLFGLKSFLVALIFLCMWLWRVSSWQNSFRLPTVEEFVRDFVLLPALVCVVLWLLKAAAHQINSKRSSAVATSSDKSGPQMPEISASVVELEIRDMEFRLPIGHSPQAIIRAMAQRIQPKIQDALKTEDGVSVRAACVPHLIADDFVALAPEDVDLLACEVRRALLLALDVLLSISMRYFEQGDAKEDLHIHYLSPAQWDGHTTNTAEKWLIGSVENLWTQPMRLHISVHPVTSALGALTYLNELNTQINNKRNDAAHVLLVSDSFIGKGLVEQWSKQSRLYRIDRPEGVMPGEGACALLLGRPSETQLNRPFARVPKANIRQRGSFVDTSTQLVFGLIEAQGGEGYEVGALISDTNHQASRQSEVADLVHNLFPGLHPTNDNLYLSVSCGEMAAVAPVIAVALAAYQSALLQKDVFVLSVQDDAWRAALLVHPPSVETQSALEESV